ncbi:DUF2750 domain-containing protein [Couchioplanes azureus]|uniref:DUF2750 domain-containing protein n=1 Tax=Couchioplanes caeruleus TaxID=56438 RepID=UPI00167153EC|nr:DUF2750 domain-containing protein [Couchioplanes caeruleus]GGQ77773.1 hypothetical protein GCM10010166_54690 [Couchioplanes caeruleus subsp. azureus]
MSLSAAHAAAFRREVPREGRVFSIRDSGGFPASGGAMPFWSKRSRAERVVAAVAAYRGFEVVEIPLADWLGSWLPGLRRDGLLVGVNWAGARATGRDVAPEQAGDWFAAP